MTTKKKSKTPEYIPIEPVDTKFLTPNKLMYDVRLFKIDSGSVFPATRSYTIYQVPSDKILRISDMLFTYANNISGPNASIVLTDSSGNMILYQDLDNGVEKNLLNKELRLVGGDKIIFNYRGNDLAASCGICVLGIEEIDIFKY